MHQISVFIEYGSSVSTAIVKAILTEALDEMETMISQTVATEIEKGFAKYFERGGYKADGSFQCNRSGNSASFQNSSPARIATSTSEGFHPPRGATSSSGHEKFSSRHQVIPLTVAGTNPKSSPARRQTVPEPKLPPWSAHCKGSSSQSSIGKHPRQHSWDENECKTGRRQ